jgi:hypothetical protein
MIVENQIRANNREETASVIKEAEVHKEPRRKLVLSSVGGCPQNILH